jgi:putative chitinase
MNITTDQLIAIMPGARKKIPTYLDPINQVIVEADLSTKMRLAMFIAQIAHESGQLVYTLELASGSAYEGRADLGNTSPGDGVRYKGRGLIQITGKANYLAIAHDLLIDVVNHPELLESPLYATRSAGWFWAKHNCNRSADTNDFITCTKRINGGTNGLADRQQFLARALQVL